MLMSVRLLLHRLHNPSAVATVRYKYLALRSVEQVVSPYDLSPRFPKTITTSIMKCGADVRHTAAERKFYDLSESYEKPLAETSKVPKDTNDFLLYIHRNVVGHRTSFSGPYGQRQVIYTDYVASGKPLKFIEDFIQAEVLPMYANTHTTTSVTALQTTLFRHEARDIIRNSVNASEHDAVIFVGSGSTGAVHKLINALSLQKSPIVFVGPFEHHSNLLPWRELGAQVIRIKDTTDGLLDIQNLEMELQRHQNSGRQLIGSFSAASNITGILTDADTVTALLHRYNALAFWDYAAAAPYTDINMNPLVTGHDQELVYKDAVFISPHKFIGGPDTPGVLIAKKKLFVNPAPLGGGGGGSVFFVTRETHSYLQQIEMREEAGTPSIIGSVRAGMVFQLKEAVTSKIIMEREEHFCRKAVSAWRKVPELIILGSLSAPRLPIFSFVVVHPKSGLMLHHNFVSALLNDLFGIQTRGGCACAGPYAQDLLGINEALALHFEAMLSEDRTLDRTHLRRYMEYSDREILRPGFTRLNFPYFMTDEEVDFIIEAVSIVAKEGWKLLPQYIFNPETGEWKHRHHQVFKDRKWLGSISYQSGRFTYKQSNESHDDSSPCNDKECLEKCEEILLSAKKVAIRCQLADQELMFDKEAAKLRWFLLPSEAKSFLLEQTKEFHHELPFFPQHFYSSSKNTEDGVFLNNIDLLNDREHLLLQDGPFNSEQNIIYSLCEDMQRDFVANLNVQNIQSQQNSTENKEETVVVLDDISGDHTLKRNNSSCASQNMCSYKGPKMEECQVVSACSGSSTSRWHSPPRSIFKPFLQAVNEFEMIKTNDRILVCLSGGKDSLSLLHTIHQYQFYCRKKGINFEFGAVTVDPGSSAYDPSPLKAYLSALNVPYFYEEQGIMKQAIELPECTSICSFCSRMKRGRIYAAARRGGYNVIALGQHLDDLTESFFMSVFHNGRLRTMKAHYTVNEKDIRVIRPFVFVREKNLRKFAEEKKLPVIAENCPACFEAPKERHRIKQLLAAQEILFPCLYWNLKSSLRPLMSINRTGVESSGLFWHGKDHNESSDDD